MRRSSGYTEKCCADREEAGGIDGGWCTTVETPQYIVILSDGTGQRGGLNFDEGRSNVYKLYRATRVVRSARPGPLGSVAKAAAAANAAGCRGTVKAERRGVHADTTFDAAPVTGGLNISLE
jgi:hypothetical protein